MAVPHPDLCHPTAIFNLAEQHELLFAVPNQVRCCGPAKRFTSTKIRNSLKHAGLARRISPVYQVVLWVRIQLDIFQAAKVLRGKLLDRHPSVRALQAHWHYNELAVVPARLAYQAAGVAIQYRQRDLFAFNRTERVQQVVHVEADLDVFAAVSNLELFLSLFLLRGCAPESQHRYPL